jgi:hypothetical protein
LVKMEQSSMNISVSSALSAYTPSHKYDKGEKSHAGQFEDGVIKQLRNEYAVAKTRAESFRPTRDMALHMRVQSQLATRIYSALASLLYASISLAKVNELERFIFKRASGLPKDYFDMTQWGDVIQIARECRQRNFDHLERMSVSASQAQRWRNGVGLGDDLTINSSIYGDPTTMDVLHQDSMGNLNMNVGVAIGNDNNGKDMIHDGRRRDSDPGGDMWRQSAIPLMMKKSGDIGSPDLSSQDYRSTLREDTSSLSKEASQQSDLLRRVQNVFIPSIRNIHKNRNMIKMELQSFYSDFQSLQTSISSAIAHVGANHNKALIAASEHVSTSSNNVLIETQNALQVSQQTAKEAQARIKELEISLKDISNIKRKEEQEKQELKNRLNNMLQSASSNKTDINAELSILQDEKMALNNDMERLRKENDELSCKLKEMEMAMASSTASVKAKDIELQASKEQVLILEKEKVEWLSSSKDESSAATATATAAVVAQMQSNEISFNKQKEDWKKERESLMSQVAFMSQDLTKVKEELDHERNHNTEVTTNTNTGSGSISISVQQALKDADNRFKLQFENEQKKWQIDYNTKNNELKNLDKRYEKLKIDLNKAIRAKEDIQDKYENMIMKSNSNNNSNSNIGRKMSVIASDTSILKDRIKDLESTLEARDDSLQALRQVVQAAQLAAQQAQAASHAVLTVTSNTSPEYNEDSRLTAEKLKLVERERQWKEESDQLHKKVLLAQNDMTAARHQVVNLSKKLAMVGEENRVKSPARQRTEAAAAELARRGLSSEEQRVALALQSASRRYLANKRVSAMKSRLVSSITNQILAYPGTKQGETGWYSHGNDMYYFVVVGEGYDDFKLLCGPVNQELVDTVAKDVCNELERDNWNFHGRGHIGASIRLPRDIQIDRIAVETTRTLIEHMSERIKELEQQVSAMSLTQDRILDGKIGIASNIGGSGGGMLSPRSTQKVVKMQAKARGYLAKARVERHRTRIAGAAQGVLVAMRNTKQGQSGWYASPDDQVYYMIPDDTDSDCGEWDVVCGPISFQSFELLEKHCLAIRSKSMGHSHGHSHPSPSKATKREHDDPCHILSKCSFEYISNNTVHGNQNAFLAASKKTQRLFLCTPVESLT